MITNVVMEGFPHRNKGVLHTEDLPRKQTDNRTIFKTSPAGAAKR
ncbi:MAG: hypothetical protein SNH88_04955 [Rikenellaceae bacterium]